MKHAKKAKKDPAYEQKLQMIQLELGIISSSNFNILKDLYSWLEADTLIKGTKDKITYSTYDLKFQARALSFYERFREVNCPLCKALEARGYFLGEQKKYLTPL